MRRCRPPCRPFCWSSSPAACSPALHMCAPVQAGEGMPGVLAGRHENTYDSAHVVCTDPYQPPAASVPLPAEPRRPHSHTCMPATHLALLELKQCPLQPASQHAANVCCRRLQRRRREERPRSDRVSSGIKVLHHAMQSCHGRPGRGTAGQGLGLQPHPRQAPALRDYLEHGGRTGGLGNRQVALSNAVGSALVRPRRLRVRRQRGCRDPTPPGSSAGPHARLGLCKPAQLAQHCAAPPFAKKKPCATWEARSRASLAAVICSCSNARSSRLTLFCEGCGDGCAARVMPAVPLTATTPPGAATDMHVLHGSHLSITFSPTPPRTTQFSATPPSTAPRVSSRPWSRFPAVQHAAAGRSPGPGAARNEQRRASVDRREPGSAKRVAAGGRAWAPGRPPRGRGHVPMHRPQTPAWQSSRMYFPGYPLGGHRFP